MERGKVGMVVTVGSINVDLVVRVESLPKPGETVLGADYEIHHGGKGANQAVAAARAGAQVRMVGAVGSDQFGEQLLRGLRDEGIDTRHVRRRGGKSGVAFIDVDEQGQNFITVSPGANSRLRVTDLAPEVFEDARCLLLQLEIPLPTVRQAAQLAKSAGAIVILNLAPAQRLSEEELADVDVLVVNEVEAAALLGGKRPESPEQASHAAEELLRFASGVVITLGHQGVVWAKAGDSEYLPGHRIEARDTTAAGDAFAGVLAARLAAGDALPEAVRWANAAGALAATREGAQPSLPQKDQLVLLLRAKV